MLRIANDRNAGSDSDLAMHKTGGLINSSTHYNHYVIFRKLSFSTDLNPSLQIKWTNKVKMKLVLHHHHLHFVVQSSTEVNI
jgi:hypothetical protein